MKKYLCFALIIAMLLTFASCTTIVKVDEEGEKETKVEETEVKVKEEETEAEEEKEAEQEEEVLSVDLFETVVPKDVLKSYPELKYIIEPEDYALLSQLDADTIEAILDLKDEVVSALKELSDASDFAFDIDDKTGTITFNAEILFDHDSYLLKDEAKSKLNLFMSYYAPVVLDTGANDYISSLIIEGHTSSTGGDAINLPLSEKRAQAVADYILSDDCVLNDEQRDAFESKLLVEGCGSERLILDDNGEEDPDASRRVTFRFVFDLDTIIANIMK